MSDVPSTTNLPTGWQAAQFDLHAFRDEGSSPASDWWTPLIGSEPESSVRKKHERVDSGEFNGLPLKVASDQIRTIWTLAPRVAVSAADGVEGFPPAIGPVEDFEKIFSGLMDRWLSSEQCPPMIRLAYNVKLFWFTNSREQNYRILAEHLPTVQIDPESRDFLYRVNRLGESAAVPSLRINRLGTWSSAQLTVQIEVMPKSDIIDSPSMRRERTDFHAAMLQLDINTDQARTSALPRESLSQLWLEMVEFGRAIANRGDCP
jgi:hypothetical protein